MKRFLSILFQIIISFVFFFNLSFATDLSNIQIITEEYPPYSYTENGMIRGINVKKVKAAMRKLNLDIKMEVMPWKRGYQITRDGENYFLFTCSRTPAREKDFKWVSVLSENNVSIYSLKEKNIKINSFEELKNYTISGVIGYRYLPYFYENGYSSGMDSKLELTRSDEANFQKLLLGRVDLIIGDSDQIEFVANKLGVNFDKFEKVYEITSLRTKDYLVTGHRTSDAVIEEIRKAFE